MFYLKCFFKIIKKYPLRGLFCCLSTIILFLVAENGTYFKEILLKNYQVEAPRPYFNTLIIGLKNINPIQRKLSELPGVYRVEIKNDLKLTNEYKRILNELEMEVPGALKSLSYRGFKVILDENVKERSQNLIREYLVRLVGKRRVVLGPTKMGGLSYYLKSSKLINLVRERGSLVMILTSSLFWFLSILLILKPLISVSKVYQTFQRKSYLSSKILFLGNFILGAVATSISFIFGNPLGIQTVVAFVLVGFISLALGQARESF